MSLTATVQLGAAVPDPVQLTPALLRQLGQPTVAITGTVATSDLEARSVSAAKTTNSAHWFDGVTTVAFSGGKYTLTFDHTVTLTDGTVAVFRASAANTGATTVEIYNSGVSKPLRKNYNAELSSGDIVAGQLVEMRYDASQEAWQMLTPPASGVATTIHGRHLGVCATNDSVTPTTKVNAFSTALGAQLAMTNASGQVRIASFAASITVCNPDMAAGVGANGRDTASTAAGWKFFHLIYNGSTYAGLFSDNGIPTLPTGYSWWCPIGEAYWNGSAFASFFQVGDEVSIETTVVTAAAYTMTGSLVPMANDATYKAAMNTVCPFWAKTVRGQFAIADGTSQTLLVTYSPLISGALLKNVCIPKTADSTNYPALADWSLPVVLNATSNGAYQWDIAVKQLYSTGNKIKVYVTGYTRH